MGYELGYVEIARRRADHLAFHLVSRSGGGRSQYLSAMFEVDDERYDSGPC